MLIALWGLLAPAWTAETRDPVLLVVPAEKEALQVALDVGFTHPTILICYKQMPNQSYALRGWNGNEWVPVSGTSYREGTFFQKAPTAAVLVSAKDSAFPQVLIPSESWSALVYGISTLETRPLIHWLGCIYDFSYKDWKWFAENYELSMADINPSGQNLKWYHQSMKENMDKTEESTLPDLAYYSVLRLPERQEEELLPEKASIEEAQEPIEEAEESAEPKEKTETEKKPSMENPLMQEAPEAVIYCVKKAKTDSSESPAEQQNAEAEQGNDENE